jgi:hypothetical protein
MQTVPTAASQCGYGEPFRPITVTHPQTGQSWTIKPEAYLKSHQLMKMVTKPDLIVLFGHYLADEKRPEAFENVEVRRGRGCGMIGCLGVSNLWLPKRGMWCIRSGRYRQGRSTVWNQQLDYIYENSSLLLSFASSTT